MLPIYWPQISRAAEAKSLTKASGLPRILPKAAQHFIGRTEEVVWLSERLLSTSRVALIGPGGIGKTAIAHRAISELSPLSDPFQHFPGGIFLHDFYATAGHLGAIENIIAQAGLGDLDDDKREPQVRALLAGARCLVYLKGCENAEDSARFLDLCGNATVLLTSRVQNDTKGSVARKIRPIHVNDAAEILIWHARNGWDPPLAAVSGRKTIWRRISTLLGRHPLALRLAGHHLGTGEQSGAEFVEVLEKEGFGHFDDDRRTKESLDLLFCHSAGRLSLDGRCAWFALSLHALAPLSITWISASLGLGSSETTAALDELVAYSLAEMVRVPAEGATREPSWLLSHALLRSWGREQLGNLGVDNPEILSR
jgi:hypothetical protein